jgi:hypothetical protein
MPAPLGFTMGLRVDLRNLVSVSPPAGIDLLYTYLCAGPQIVVTVEWPVFGLLPARELAELAIDTLGFQHYWKTARLYLAARWWLIGAGKLLRIGGKIVAEAARCRNVRPMLGNVARSAAIEAAGPPPSPTSSRARLEALIAETRRDAGIVIHGARAQSTAQLIVTHDRRSFLGIVLRNAGSMELRVRLRTDKISQGLGPYSTWHPQGARNWLAGGPFHRAPREYYLKDKAELSRICDRLANALAPDGRLLSAHSFVLRDDLRHTGFDWHGPFGAKAIAESLSRVSRLSLERSIQTAPSFWPGSGVRSAP